MSQFESIDRVLKKERLSLQEVKKKMGGGSNSSSDNNVRTNTNRNPNDTIFGDNKNKKKKFINQDERPTGETPPKNEKPLTKHQRERAKTAQKRTQYGLKPDSRGVYKPTKPGLKSSLSNQIGYSSTPPKPSAKKDVASLKKYNQQVRKSEKYSGNEKQKRVKKLVDRAYKNQKIDKSKAGLVQRMKDIAYGKNPYKKVFGSTGLNVQKKYDKQMIEVGGKLNKLQTPKQLEKLKAKIASKPVEKTMTYLSPAGSGKPVPLKTRIKKIPKPEIEKIIPNRKFTQNLGGKLSQTTLGNPSSLAKTSRHLMKHKNKYAVAAGLTLAGGAYLLGKTRLKTANKNQNKALLLAKQKKAKEPKKMVDVSLFLNKTGTPPTKTSKPKFNSVYDKDYIKNLKPKTTTPKNNPISKYTSGVSNAAKRNAALPYDSSKIASYAKPSQRSSKK